MKLYLVYRTDEIGFDEFDSHVVRAKNPEEALAMVGWADGKPTADDIECEELSTKGAQETILSSFNAG